MSKYLTVVWAVLILAATASWAEVEGRIQAVDAPSGTITAVFAPGQVVKARDVFVIVQDGKSLGECMVVAVNKNQATLMAKANFHGNPKNGDLARFVRHAEAPAGDYVSLDENEHRALDMIRQNLMQAKRSKVTRELGFALGHIPFEDTPRQGALLIGFNITCNSSAANGMIQSVQPLFQTAEGPLAGTVRGKMGSWSVSVHARKGYAVGALTIKSALEVLGMSVTFMKIDNGGLNPRDSYTSQWIGSQEGGKEPTTTTDGACVIGIYGRCDSLKEPIGTVKSLGLVLAP